MRKNLLALTTCLMVGTLLLPGVALGGTADTVYEVTGTYSDPENDVYIELFMEPLQKFLFFAASADPLSASDPERIRSSAAMVEESTTPWKTFDLERTVVVPATTMGTWGTTIDPTPFGNQGLLLAGEPYIILAIYSDLVARSTDGISPATTSYYGTHSPGVFIFGPDVALDTPTPTPTATPIGPTPTPLPFGLTVEAEVDPNTGRPTNGQLDDEDKVDISWVASDLQSMDATLRLFFDRDNQLEATYLDSMNNLVSEVIVAGASRLLPLNATLSQEGIEEIDWGPIDLTTDPRFSPPPDTGTIPAFQYPMDVFRWDFSQVPAGVYYVYGVLESKNQGLVVDYATYTLIISDGPRWPILIGEAVDDRFVHGVALDDVVQSATELDVVAVAQSGLFRVYDYLGRPWPPYLMDLQTTIDTAPTTADIDADGQVEILLGTNQQNSDQNPVFASRNALLMIDPQFKDRYDALLMDLSSKISKGVSAEIEQALIDHDLRQNFHFSPNGHGIFTTPAVHDLDGDGIPEVIAVDRPMVSGTPATLEAVSFAGPAGSAPTVKGTIQLGGVGFIGAPSVGNVDADGNLEVVMGTEFGHILVVELLGANMVLNPANNASVFQVVDSEILKPSVLRPPVLVDVDGDGIDEILFGISTRDTRLEDQTQMYLIRGNGAPYHGGNGMIFEPDREFCSLSTPVVGPLNSAPGSPLVALFTTTNGLYAINLATNTQVFAQEFGNQERAFAGSSPVIGQTMLQNAGLGQRFEFFVGGGRDQRGNLFGWYYNDQTDDLVQVDGIAAFPEPISNGYERPGSILGSLEMADTNGDKRTEVFYTNEHGWVDRFESPGEATTRIAGVIPSDFPWPAYKHDRQRTGRVATRPNPVAPFLPGDINRDGVVDENDLFKVASDWSQSATGAGTKADANNSGKPQSLLMVIQGCRK
jgi:hypothetical protein